MNSAGGLMAMVTANPASTASAGSAAAGGLSRSAHAQPVREGLSEFASTLLESVAPVATARTPSLTDSTATANSAVPGRSATRQTGQTGQTRETREEEPPPTAADLPAPEQ